MTNDNNTANPSEDGFVIDSKIYNKLKFVALVLLPALSTLYFTLGSLWGFPNVEQVIGTIAALDTFLGAVVGISSRNYNNSDARFDGEVVVTHKPDGTKLFSLELNDMEPMDALETKDSLTFKVPKN